MLDKNENVPLPVKSELANLLMYEKIGENWKSHTSKCLSSFEIISILYYTKF